MITMDWVNSVVALLASLAVVRLALTLQGKAAATARRLLKAACGITAHPDVHRRGDDIRGRSGSLSLERRQYWAIQYPGALGAFGHGPGDITVQCAYMRLTLSPRLRLDSPILDSDASEA